MPVRDIYREGFSSATIEVGGLLTDLVKVLRLTLAPLQIGAALQDRFRRFIERSAAAVPEEQRTLPPPQMVGPILEAIRYEPEGSMTDEAFSILLSRAFDREKTGQAHPAFPGILRALSIDELQLLRLLLPGILEIPCRRIHLGVESRIDIDVLRQAVPILLYPEHLLVYCEHLESLGLVRPLIITSTENSDPDGSGSGLMFWQLRLSDFGRLFISATSKTQ